MIPFLRYNKMYLTISIILLVISVLGIFVLGFRYSVEFIGGTNLQYSVMNEVALEQVEKVLQEQEIELNEASIDEDTLRLKTKPLTDQEEQQLRSSLSEALGQPVTVQLVETVGPSLSTDNLVKTAVATTLAIIGILVYIAFAFRNMSYAIGAVVALFHDVFILVGSYAFVSYYLGAELDTLFVTAALTTMSFSVHDTIVMFDQLRMYTKKHGKQQLVHHADRAITDTIMRSINNSMTIIFMLLALLLLGGETIRWFAFALLIGTIIGTYSSPFVSIPVAVWVERRRKNKNH